MADGESRGGPSAKDEADGVDDRHFNRIARIYAGYATSRRRRRAWASDNQGNVAIRSELTGALGEVAEPAIQSGGDILDVGCGSGWWLRELARRGVRPERLHGIDLLPDRVTAVSASLPDADVRQGNALALPYADASFALVTLVVTLSSLPDGPAVTRALSEAWRVVAPGGRLAVYEPRYVNPANPHTRLVRARDRDDVLGRPAFSRTLTVVPPVARFAGGLPPSMYQRLARLPVLRTHRLSVYERPARTLD